MARPKCYYFHDLLKEFYVSYSSSIYQVNPRRARYIEHPKLEHTLVRGVLVDTFVVAIHRVLFRPEYASPTSTLE